MKYACIILFCIVLNGVSPKCNPASIIKVDEDLAFGTKLTRELTEESKKNLQLLIKNKLIKNREIPETATITVESICLDKSHRDLFAGQGYIVKSLASWTTFFPHKGKAGLYILKMNKHNEHFVSCFSNDNLKQAKVEIPE